MGNLGNIACSRVTSDKKQRTKENAEYVHDGHNAAGCRAISMRLLPQRKVSATIWWRILNVLFIILLLSRVTALVQMLRLLNKNCKSEKNMAKWKISDPGSCCW